MKMNFEAFQNHCARWMMEYSYAFQLLTKSHAFKEGYFHVTVPASAFESFCHRLEQGQILIVISSELRRQDHVHMICHLKEKEVEEEVPIRNFEYLRFVLIQFILFRDRHDTLCPDPENEETLFQLPQEWSGNPYAVDWETDFARVDPPAYPVDFVVWFQHPTTCIKLPFDHYQRLCCVLFDFLAEDGKRIPRCLECARVSLKGNLWRRYVSAWLGRDVVQSPANWCRLCKRVPLFQILTRHEWVAQYGDKKREDCILQLDYFSSSEDEKKTWRIKDSLESKDEFVSRYDDKGRVSIDWFQGKDALESDENLTFQFNGYVGPYLYQEHMRNKLMYGY